MSRFNPGRFSDLLVLSSDPPISSSNVGDKYFNSVLNMEMFFDPYRERWLSGETVSYRFGRAGSTAPGSFFKSVEGFTFTPERGYLMQFNGTIVSLSFSQENSDSIFVEILSNGTEIYSTEVDGSSVQDDNVNCNFQSGDILSFKNKSGGNISVNGSGLIRVKWRI